MLTTKFDLERFFGNVSARNPGQFEFHMDGERLRWTQLLTDRAIVGSIDLRADESYEDFHQRFWDTWGTSRAHNGARAV